jgi:hypothetical protein
MREQGPDLLPELGLLGSEHEKYDGDSHKAEADGGTAAQQEARQHDRGSHALVPLRD